MSFLQKNFERLKNEGLKETFEVLELAFKKYGIDYYLIGARARDLWTDHIALGEKRTSEDVDFCVLKPTGGAGLYTSAMDRLFSSALELTAIASITTPNYVATGMTAFGIVIENWSGWIRSEGLTPMQVGSLKEHCDTRRGRIGWRGRTLIVGVD